jgi:hypothetical protein
MTLLKKIRLTTLLIVTMLVANFTRADIASWDDWNQVLQATVTEKGFVDYDAIAKTGKINAIIEAIANTDTETLTSTADRLAFYVNSYNVLVIKTILDGKSPSNVFSRLSFFKGPEYNVAGTDLNLSDLEHKIIRPLNEPRIHFALVCAALSCPKLLNTIYTAPKLDKQFDTAASQFINNVDRNHFEPDKQIAHLSKIFDWFSEDFELNGSSVSTFIASYINDETLAEELLQGGYKIKYNNYYWSLNGVFENLL